MYDLHDSVPMRQFLRVSALTAGFFNAYTALSIWLLVYVCPPPPPVAQSGGGSLAPTVHGVFGAEEKFPSCCNVVGVQRSGLGPSA